jgi:hypothetical protein
MLNPAAQGHQDVPEPGHPKYDRYQPSNRRCS